MLVTISSLLNKQLFWIILSDIRSIWFFCRTYIFEIRLPNYWFIKNAVSPTGHGMDYLIRCNIVSLQVRRHVTGRPISFRHYYISFISCYAYSSSSSKQKESGFSRNTFFVLCTIKSLKGVLETWTFRRLWMIQHLAIIIITVYILY